MDSPWSNRAHKTGADFACYSAHRFDPSQCLYTLNAVFDRYQVVAVSRWCFRIKLKA
jgi:hypothetical protein